MRLKRFICMVMALVAMVSCFSVSAVAASHMETEVETQAVYASGRFDMDVPGKTTVKAKSSFPLEIGEVVTIKATYSPFSASVDFGLIAPDGLFYSINTKTGSFDEAIEVTCKFQSNGAPVPEERCAHSNANGVAVPFQTA